MPGLLDGRSLSALYVLPLFSVPYTPTVFSRALRVLNSALRLLGFTPEFFMPKSRKNVARGRLAVHARLKHPPPELEECMICLQPITPEQRKLYKLAKVMPCGHTGLHWNCQYTTVLYSQVQADLADHRCCKCRQPISRIHRWGVSSSGSPRTQQVCSLPLSIPPQRMRVYRARSSRSWARVGDDTELSPQESSALELRDRASRAEYRAIREEYTRAAVRAEELDFREVFLATLTSAGFVSELASRAQVQRLGAILYHARLQNPGTTASHAPDAPPVLLRDLYVQPTDTIFSPAGVQGLAAEGFPTVAFYCGSPDIPAFHRAEAVSYVRCRLVMEGVAHPRVSGTLLKPLNWQCDTIE